MDICKRRENNIVNRDNHLPSNLWRGFLLLTFFVLFVVPIVSSVEVDMKSDFSQGETLLASFSGTFVDQITPNNVFFYRGHVAIPMTYGVVKIEDDFYVYALLTNKNPGNYSISIEGVRYYKATQIVDDDIVSNFTISEETAEFSLNPGVVSTAEDFSVELQNLKDNSITVTITGDSSLDFQPTVSLNTGEKKTVNFNLNENSVRGLTYVTFSSGNISYEMPVYLDTNNTEIGDEISENFDMEFQPRRAGVSLATNSDSKKILYLKNTGEETLEDVFFSISPVLESYITVSPEKISRLSPGETEQIEIRIVSDLEEATIEGRITAYTEDTSASFTLVLDFIKDFIPPEDESEELTSQTLCEDLNGIVCADNLVCNGNIVRSKNGDCCIAPLVCQEPKKSSTGKIIGWGLLLLVLVIAYWFFRRKYRGIQKRRPF